MKDYSNAYTEVYTIINNLDEEELNKIPEEVQEAISTHRNTEYFYELNEELDLQKQPMLPETKALLFNLFRDYLSTPEQREKIKRMQAEDRRKLEEKKKQEYGEIDIFKTKIQIEDSVEDIHPVIKGKDNILIKVINFIKKYIIKRWITNVWDGSKSWILTFGTVPNNWTYNIKGGENGKNNSV